MRKKLPAKKSAPPPISDETAKLIADAASGIVNWIRATPQRTVGALFVAGLVGVVLTQGSTDNK